MSSFSNVVRLPRPDVHDPIAALESIATENKWPLEKHADDEVSFDCIGRWGELTMSFLWQDDCQALQLCCMSDLRVTDVTRKAVQDMLYDVNRKVWAGFFTLDDAEDFVVYRYTSLLRHTHGDMQEHVEDLIEIALAELDRFYPAFQSVTQITAQPTPRVTNGVLLSLLTDPMGEA